MNYLLQIYTKRAGAKDWDKNEAPIEERMSNRRDKRAAGRNDERNVAMTRTAGQIKMTSPRRKRERLAQKWASIMRTLLASVALVTLTLLQQLSQLGKCPEKCRVV